MQKSFSDDPLTIDDDANLWLCEGVGCDPNAGQGQLNINEWVFNVQNDPDGAGAFEFQIKFDHKLFDLDVSATSWLSYGEDGLPGGGDDRVVECDITVVTENWILFGCVSTGGIDNGATSGSGTAGEIAATITVRPQDDLKYRMTPGNDNGIFDVILDENCEIADPLGHPLELPGWANDGIDNDGDTVVDEPGEGLAPGVGPGGMLDECSDVGITIRILEGDLNLDCAVDVLDQQAIAFRYGATFGLLLYDQWYDLEPALKDFDIDIKDLQKVWGRNGSTCENPIPAQDPVPFPLW
jgi:hypothetical protein